MTFRRIALILLTLVAIAKVLLSLGESVQQPQFQNRLELYQADLVLTASQWQPPHGEMDTWRDLRGTLLGGDPYGGTLKTYETARDKLDKQVQQLTQQLQENGGDPAVGNQLRGTLHALRLQQGQDALKLGLVWAVQGDLPQARQQWQQVIAPGDRPQDWTRLQQTAMALDELWQTPGQCDRQTLILAREQLAGWFQGQVLRRCYDRLGETAAIAEVSQWQQQEAEKALTKLLFVGGMPLLVGGAGLLLLLGLAWQWWRKRPQAVLNLTPLSEGERVPWDGFIAWEVLIFGFFAIGQLLLPLVFGLLPLQPALWGVRGKAIYVLFSYLLLSGGSLGVWYALAIRPFGDRPWLRWQGKNWWLWGMGGYVCALPLVVGISLINQQLWQGQGGSNPLLSLTLQSRDPVAIALLVGTAAVMAPLFEETLFRGFLLPSLARYFSPWQSVVLSGFIFAVAHLSASEVLPLTVLGMVLGFVYWRSRNLAASMLLHGLWNSGTLMSLLILGNG